MMVNLIDSTALRFSHAINDDGKVYVPLAEVLHAPTVDAVPVVRCKDCKFHKYKWCNLHETTMYNEDFCSYGERKDGEHDDT